MSGDDRTELPLRASDADRKRVAGLLGEAKVSAFALFGSVTIHRAEVKEGDG